MPRSLKPALTFALLWLASASAARADVFFEQTNLVSDIPGLALHTDPNLKNPWGLSYSPNGPFWVSNQATNTSTLYDGDGEPFPAASPLVVSIPNRGVPGPVGPTGQVVNGSSADFLLSNGESARFIFANLDGSISAWNGGLGANAELRAASASGAIYTGLASATVGGSGVLYAADALGGKIDVYDSSFSPTSLSGSFVDPNLPAGFSPYNIQRIGDVLYVAYEIFGQPGGVVNAFDLEGNFLRRIAANDAAGPLQNPWGLALAPSTFGQSAGSLLVGNFGDGRISAFDPTTGAFLGQLLDGRGDPIANSGLWGLIEGNGAAGGEQGVLYFAAGINGQQNGLFGAIRAVPEPSSLALFGLGGLALAGWRLRNHRRVGGRSA